MASQAGYIYYATPQNLTNCAQFTVSFEFRITNSSSPTADGLAFWYISNPPTGFTVGGGIGLPNNPNGLLLIMDTYNNVGGFNNPKVSLRRYDGTVNYTEDSPTGQLAPDLTSQSFITNGNWHTCVLTYYFGAVTVAFDGNPPVMTGNTTLNLNGYFGFSAGTGASWAKHAIRNVNVIGAPEPDAPVANDITYCQGEQALPLTAVGNNLSWFTTPTGGTALPGAPIPSTLNAGTFEYYVSQAVPGCNVASVRDTLTVTVNPKPAPPTITVPGYCSDQAPEPFTIVTGTNVLWYDAANGGTGTTTMPIVDVTTPGNFTWYATQTNAFGCESSRIAVTATVRQTPVADFNFDIGYACGNDTVHFNNTSTNASGYFWDFADGLTDTASNPSHLYTNQGTYYVRLRAENEYCADSTIKAVLIAHPLEASFTVSNDTICEGSSVVFSNTSIATNIYGVDPQYFWSFDDGTTSTLQNPTHVFTAPRTYNVMMVVKNNIPCYDTTYQLITVDSLPSIFFTRSDTAICTGDQIEFTADYTRSGLQELVWNFGDAPDVTKNVNPAFHSYETPGTYTVTLNGNYRICADVSQTFQVTVKELPTLNLGPDTTLCLKGAAIVLSDYINVNNPKASWKWSHTNVTTSSAPVKHDGIITGTVTIDQCSTSDVVVVTKDCQIDIPNSFTPNGDGTNDYFFPRQFLSSGVASFTMSIFNRWGQVIFETSNPNGRGWDGKFNDKEQPMGVYIYTIKVVMKNGVIEDYTGNVTLLK